MIITRLHIGSKCQDCPEFRETVSVVKNYAGTSVNTDVHIFCERSSICRHIEEHLKELYEGEN